MWTSYNHTGEDIDMVEFSWLPRRYEGSMLQHPSGPWCPTKRIWILWYCGEWTSELRELRNTCVWQEVEWWPANWCSHTFISLTISYSTKHSALQQSRNFILLFSVFVAYIIKYINKRHHDHYFWFSSNGIDMISSRSIKEFESWKLHPLPVSLTEVCKPEKGKIMNFKWFQ